MNLLLKFTENQVMSNRALLMNPKSLQFLELLDNIAFQTSPSKVAHVKKIIFKMSVSNPFNTQNFSLTRD